MSDRSVDDDSIARTLGQALREHGLYGVLIDVADGHVTLTGDVESPEDEDRALELVAGTPGVNSVRAELVVSDRPQA
jgi:osmotically-inducible protein OsmY